MLQHFQNNMKYLVLQFKEIISKHDAICFFNDIKFGSLVRSMSLSHHKFFVSNAKTLQKFIFINFPSVVIIPMNSESIAILIVFLQVVKNMLDFIHVFVILKVKMFYMDP